MDNSKESKRTIDFNNLQRPPKRKLSRIEVRISSTGRKILLYKTYFKNTLLTDTFIKYNKKYTIVGIQSSTQSSQSLQTSQETSDSISTPTPSSQPNEVADDVVVVVPNKKIKISKIGLFDNNSCLLPLLPLTKEISSILTSKLPAHSSKASKAVLSTQPPTTTTSKAKSKAVVVPSSSFTSQG
jgi:hypothetical protein